MASLNHKGPEEKGSKTGRMLGLCKKSPEELKQVENFELGMGMGMKRKESFEKGKSKRSLAGLDKLEN